MTTTSPTIEILFEDEWLLAVNKPAGIHSARAPGSAEPCMADLLRECRPELEESSPSKLDGGLVNRLDRGTSGVLLAAKDRRAWEALHRELTEGGSEKEYRALIEGVLSERLDAEGFIGSEYRRGKKVSVSPRMKPRFQPAHTEFSPLQTFSSLQATLVSAVARTGRRHQIRAHAASIGHPLVGDRLYGAARDLTSVEEFDRAHGPLPEFFLHAVRVTMKHPKTCDPLIVAAPLPGYAPF